MSSLSLNLWSSESRLLLESFTRLSMMLVILKLKLKYTTNLMAPLKSNMLQYFRKHLMSMPFQPIANHGSMVATDALPEKVRLSAVQECFACRKKKPSALLSKRNQNPKLLPPLCHQVVSHGSMAAIHAQLPQKEH